MKKRILYLLLAIAGFFQFACKKNSGGTPVINSVRAIDSTKRDSFFVKSYPGLEIVIDGANLDGVQAVFFNDTAASFNPVYNTSTHLIVSIPASAPTAATNSHVPSLIRVVTSHGTATYSFTLVEPPPYISSISFDNTGTMVFINGANFEGIKSVTFPGGDTAVSYTVNKAFNQISAIIPAGTAGIKDSLRLVVYYGTASYPFPPPMTITGVDNENAIAGSTLTFHGTNLIGVKQVMFPGGLLGTNITEVDVNTMTVTVPAGITGPDTIRISGILGKASTPELFDTYVTRPTGYLCDFSNQYASDNTGYVGWMGGYDNAAAAVADYPGAANGVGYFIDAVPMKDTAGMTVELNGGDLQLNDIPWVSNTSLPIANYALKFELFIRKPWSSGAIWILMGDWYAWHNYMTEYEPWLTAPGGVVAPTGWQTVTIPLTKFLTITGTGVTIGNKPGNNGDNNEWDFGWFPAGGAPAQHFSDFTSTALSFAIASDQPSPVAAKAMDLAIDNVRIEKYQ